MKRQINIAQMKEQTRNTQYKKKKRRRRGNRQSTWKIIQKNDSKDDPKP